MKLKYLFPLFIAALALMTSCEDEETMTLLDEIQVSSSYVSIPVDGGSTTITVSTEDKWTIEKVTTDEDDVEWLTVSPTSGSAGEADLTFSAESTLDGRTAEVLLINWHEIQTADGTTYEKTTQRINVIQGLATISPATCAEIIAGPDSKTYQVTGVVTAITNTTYGNWYLEDETGSIYIYGTLDASGSYNFLDLGIEVGDEITVVGPKTTYNGTVELVDVSVVNINKSLVKVDSVQNAELPIEGGEFTAYITCKGEGVSVEIPEDAKSWLSISSIQSAGTDVVVKFKAEENQGGDRGTTLTFHTTYESKDYSTETSITQAGAIVDATIAEFLAAEVGNSQYRLTGVITNIVNDKYGNIYLKDFSGEAFVYGIEDFQDKDLKVGDIITLIGKRSAYNGSPQVGDAVLEDAISVIPATIAEVLTKEDSYDIYYMVTGEITAIDNSTYGNLYLQADGSEIFLYGCYPGYGASGDDRKYLIDDKGIKVGDQLTVIATKGSYNGVDQLSNGIYFSHESAE